MLVLPFAFPKDLLSSLRTQAENMTARVDGDIPQAVRDSAIELNIRFWIDVDVDPAGRLLAVDLTLDSERSQDRTASFTHEVEIDFAEEEDPVEDGVGAFEKAWLVHAARERVSQARELCTWSDEDLTQWQWPNLRTPEIEAFLALPAGRFMLQLVYAEIAQRAHTVGKHAELQSYQKSRPLAALVRQETEVATAWWESLMAGEQAAVWNGRPKGIAHFPEEEQVVHLYRDWHLERDGVFPLFDVWGNPRSDRPHRSGAALVGETVQGA